MHHSRFTESTYSSYLPPDPQIGFNGDSQSSQRFSPPSLQHARDIMAFSERVAMPPMPAPAPGSRSPSTLSGGSKPRDGSPTLPPTRDELMSQRSMTPLDVVPQKRSGKLPAAGKSCSLPRRRHWADFGFSSDYYPQELAVGSHSAPIPH